MTTPATIAETVTRITSAHQRLLDAIAPLTSAELQAPLLSNDWSVKDLLAHLTFWDQRLLHAVEPEGGPDAFRLAPPVIADIPYGEQWTNTVNARIYELNRARHLRAIQTEFAETRRRVLAVVGSLTEYDAFDPNGLSAAIGIPFEALLRDAYEHYEEHTEELEALQR
jgi:uncharacterized damage-inducible protein DinB